MLFCEQQQETTVSEKRQVCVGNFHECRSRLAWRGLAACLAQGLGLGTKLLKISLDWMEAHTDGPLWIGVWSGNEKAQKLYAAYGFSPHHGQQSFLVPLASAHLPVFEPQGMRLRGMTSPGDGAPAG